MLARSFSHQRRRSLLSSLLTTIAVIAISPVLDATRADLAKARSLYNSRQFDAAIDAAAAARRTPATADAAAIVQARAHLERYRERVDPADLSAARAALGSVRAAGLDARDRIEYLLAAGQSLFLEDDFGAAAELFESALERASEADPQLLDALLDWWGSATERRAAALPRDERVAAFRRLGARMADEVSRNAASAAASYWSVVALRGQGEARRAWDAAIAAWLRARLAGEQAASLRADLDRLMQQGIIPDRVGSLPADRRAAAESDLRAEWELVKEKWK